MSDLSNVRVNGQRLWDSLMEMAKIGGTPKGGCKRLTLTDLDKQGRELFRALVREGGLHGQGRRDGQHVRAPRRRRGRSAAGGDRQPSRHPADRRQVRRRARRARRARSRALAQRPQDQDPLSDRGRQLDQRGRLALRAGDGLVGRVRRRLHQGIRLFARSTPRARSSATSSSASASRARSRSAVGRSTPSSSCTSSRGRSSRTRIATSASSPTARASAGTRLTLTGFESHAGSTPMPRRKDALLGAARIVELVNAIGLSKAPLGVSTCGMINPYPNSRNVIPGEVFLACEFRHPVDATLSEMDAALHEGRQGDLRKDRPRPTSSSRSSITRPSPSTGMRRRGAPRGRAFRLHASRHRLRRRARCLLHGARRADVDDLHALRRRRQPQRERGHQAGMVDRRRQRLDARRCWKRRKSLSRRVNRATRAGVGRNQPCRSSSKAERSSRPTAATLRTC